MEYLVQQFRTKTTEIVCRGTEQAPHNAKRFKVSAMADTETVNCPKCNQAFKVRDFIGIH